MIYSYIMLYMIYNLHSIYIFTLSLSSLFSVQSIQKDAGLCVFESQCFLKHMCNMYTVYVSSDGVQDWQTQDSCVTRCIIFAYV